MSVGSVHRPDIDPVTALVRPTHQVGPAAQRLDSGPERVGAEWRSALPHRLRSEVEQEHRRHLGRKAAHPAQRKSREGHDRDQDAALGHPGGGGEPVPRQQLDHGLLDRPAEAGRVLGLDEQLQRSTGGERGGEQPFEGEDALRSTRAAARSRTGPARRGSWR